MQYEYRLSNIEDSKTFIAEQKITESSFKTFGELKSNLIENERYTKEYDSITADTLVNRIISSGAAPIWMCSRPTA